MLTLGLNMIVGPGEAQLLKRCLNSFDAKNAFDEIIIVNTSLDKSIEAVARIYTDKYYTYAWETSEHPYGNFGGARDFARRQSTTDKIMWLDTDDVCLPEHKDKWSKARDLIKDEQYRDVVMWSMPYTIIIDDNGKPVSWFRRERVFDREIVEWRRPVHEMMWPEWDQVKHAEINGMHITHLPVKPTYVSAVRNVKILESEYKNNPFDTQTRYFLGRDLMYIGRAEEGIKILESIVNELTASYEMLYAIAIELTYFYAYGCSNPHPEFTQYKKENIDKVESWSRLAMSFCPEYAEPVVVLGDTYIYKGKIDAAAKLYVTASKKKLGEGKFQSIPFYGELPAERLMHLYTIKQDYGLALHYNSMAMRYNAIQKYVDARRVLIEKLAEEFNNEFCKN